MRWKSCSLDGVSPNTHARAGASDGSLLFLERGIAEHPEQFGRRMASHPELFVSGSPAVNAVTWEAWLDFVYAGHAFSVHFLGNGEAWFFCESDCPAEIREQLAAILARL